MGDEFRTVSTRGVGPAPRKKSSMRIDNEDAGVLAQVVAARVAEAVAAERARCAEIVRALLPPGWTDPWAGNVDAWDVASAVAAIKRGEAAAAGEGNDG